MRFEITQEQQKQIDEWFETLIPKILEIQETKNSLRSTIHEGEPYYGAIGGGLTYSFTPTGLGEICVVQEYTTKEELNVTNFDEW